VRDAALCLDRGACIKLLRQPGWAVTRRRDWRGIGISVHLLQVPCQTKRGKRGKERKQQSEMRKIRNCNAIGSTFLFCPVFVDLYQVSWCVLSLSDPNPRPTKGNGMKKQKLSPHSPLLGPFAYSALLYRVNNNLHIEMNTHLRG
jgi:hypothetical protein